MQRKQGKMLVFLLALLLTVMLVPLAKAKAESKLQIVEIDYDKETLTVSTSNGDSYLYYSDAKMKTWERAIGKFEDNKCVLDISWVTKTKDYVLTLKGDKSDTVLSVTLPMQNKSLKVTYNCITESFVVTGANGCDVYWRKSDSTKWIKVEDDASTRAVLQRLYARGATLYLRAAQKLGTSTDAGARPSKEVKITLSKQAAAPSLTLKTGGMLTVTAKQEYQLAGAADWTTGDGKAFALADIATAAYGDSAQDTDIYVRVAATEKKLPSANAVITVRAQEEAPADIEHSFKNSSTLQLTIAEQKDEDGNVTREKPSSKNPYQYTIVEAGKALEDDAAWTSITSETVLITAEKAPEGSTIYVRKSSLLESKTVFQPESKAWSYVVEEYPAGSTVTLAGPSSDEAFIEKVKDEEDDTERDVVRLVKEEGTSSSGLKFKITVEEQFKDPDVSSITCGGKSLKFTTDVTNQDIIVTITDTTAYEEAVTTRDEAQALKITLNNGEVLSDQVTLEVLHGASVKAAKSFTVTHRITEKQTGTYEFVVIPGLLLATDTSGEHKKTEISKITFRDKELLKDSDWTITTDDSDGSYKVTIKESAFDDAFFADNKLDTAYPVIIEMDNEQVIASGVSVKLYENATLVNGSHFYLKSMSEEDEADIELTFTCTNATDYIIAAQWDGIDIMGSSSGSSTEDGEAIIVKLSAKKLNSLTMSGNLPITKPVVFTLKDGGIVSLAFSLTLTQ